MIIKFIGSILLFCLCTISLQQLTAQEATQEPKSISTKEAYEKNYKERITQEVLFGVYIPEDIDDALDELNRLTDKESILKFKSAAEDTIAHKIHFSLGRWMIHNWGFYEGSRLSHHLKEKGIAHPDDMATFLIVSWYRDLNGIDQNYEQRIKDIADKVLKEKEERDKDKKVISVERKKVKKE